MKNSPFKLHQIVGAILLVAIVATGGFGSAAAFLWPQGINAPAAWDITTGVDTGTHGTYFFDALSRVA